MRKLYSMAVLGLVLLSCNENEKSTNTVDEEVLNHQQIEQEVWNAIESRFKAWKDNDFDTYLAYYHPEWKRWASGKDELTTKEEIAGFWAIMKEQEECIEMEVTPISIRLSNDGRSAIAHYTHTETFIYQGEDKPDGRTKGNTFKGTLRWSDFMIKENEKWLVIGGHRDMSMPEGKLIQVKAK
ncbi:DUF4440 domain-containing protein [Robiginitalea sp. SC105]|uniref:YybH family protein n=1 Tax=Robiginitalea sp. SC105 TaxID=2762332 RepID=UPI00163AE338|nr:nuclear transport factor 2 family protein [Robiginitalea sp. SC105]MBC2839722.1 nuclear transport factor 2 family protein [Robiginitalea sp. SC105]